MNRSDDALVVGMAQIAPVWLDRERTVAKVVRWIHEAADRGCGLVAFGETLIPGYPFWLEHTDGARFNSQRQKEIHAVYLQQAVDLDAGHLQAVCDAARSRGIFVVLGCYERPRDRGGHTGYCSLVCVDSTGRIRSAHRKLMPTYEERLAWGIGDGQGLRVFPVGPFTLGGLNCWENWMPLARSALYALGENLHVALWPGSRRNTESITRFVAQESRSFVVSVSGVLKRDQVPSSVPHYESIIESLPDTMADGGSCIAGPDGQWVAPPVDDREQLVVAELSMNKVLQERQNFDPSGHYARPDVFQLHVNQQRQTLLRREPADGAESDDA